MGNILINKVYQPQNNEELKESVNLWISNRYLALMKFGHISTWNTSLVIDMSYLFSYHENHT